jgi:hypothetical protein
MPVWLLLIVLVLGSYRITRLVTRDDFPPVLWVRDKLAGGWRPLTTKEQESVYTVEPLEPRPWSSQVIDGVEHRYVKRWTRSPWWVADLISCPWCVSAYVSLVLVWTAALTVGVPDPTFVWFAVWGASALLASKEWA